jgi:hypothetical protein
MSSSSTPPPIAAVIPIGPSARDQERIDDLLHALAHHGPATGPVIISNDGADGAALLARLHSHRLEGHVLPNPRAGRGPYWMGRLTAGLGNAYAYLRQHYPQHHVLKIDSDALVIRSFHSRLAALVSSHPSVGLIGSDNLHYLPVMFKPPAGAGGDSPADGQQSRDSADSETFDATLWHRTTYRMSKPVARWTEPPFLRQNLFGATGAMRHLLLLALANGYEWGRHANGGSYLLTAEANRRLGTLPGFAHPGVIANDWVTEDVFFGIAVYAAGLLLLPQQEPGDVIASCWKGLVGDNLDAVMARDNCIIHSVKDWGHFKETTTREYFRARRLAL